MLKTLAIAHYRSLRDLVVPLNRLNVVTGANGSGKSNLYRALRLLALTAQGRVTGSLAREGGLESALWAGPESFSRAPEVLTLRDQIRSWRFYDHFRTDPAAPARQSQVGTYTPVLDDEGRDLAAALQTIREIGDAAALDEAIADAFPGSSLTVNFDRGRFAVEMRQHGLLLALAAQVLSDGTLRYLLLITVMLTQRPPLLMIFSDPEMRLHPDLITM